MMRTPKAERLLSRMEEKIKDGWSVVASDAGPTIRYNETRATPEWAKDRGYYPFESYDNLVFVKLIGSKAMIRVHSAPWMSAREFPVSLDFAFNVLDNPNIVALN